MSKVSIPRGMRDFGPAEVKKRQYIINTIKDAFEQFGFQPIETPVMEKLSTLMGKYGEEGDKLLFKVLNQGEKIRKANTEALANGELGKFAASIAERGMRYDLTIPFARYVVMNKGTLVFPFKRYQIQNVWRGDKPQKGRYREFYQCDADVIGTTSLISEAELVQIFDKVYEQLGIDVTIKLNNRKILAGIAEVIGVADRFMEMTVVIDKLDKIGIDGVVANLERKEFPNTAINELQNILSLKGSFEEKVNYLATLLANSEVGTKGVAELRTLLGYLEVVSICNNVELDITLARGLNYYTGTILEVTANTDKINIGSIGGGGRYDDLTGTFGLKDMSGVGISFGLDRIYDVLEELNLFEDVSTTTTKVLIANYGGENELFAFKCLQQLRAKNIPAEIYPEKIKDAKQLKYAKRKGIPNIIFTDQSLETEAETKTVILKNLDNGYRDNLTMEEVIAKLA